MCEVLVIAAERIGEALGMSTTIIGIVFLDVEGGAVECFSAIPAKKNKVRNMFQFRTLWCTQPGSNRRPAD
jgi:hypothetical protein